MTTLVDYSLIIPAYNESKRLPHYLSLIRPYLDVVFQCRYEVIVVDDGSDDDLPDLLECSCAIWPQLSFVRYLDNQGKGVAIRSGMLSARAALLLFADADGATPIEEEQKLRDAIHQGAAGAVGSRFLRSDAAVQRTWHRGALGKTFASLTRHIFGLPVLDTQCGFKMFRREAGLRLARLCRQAGYLLDVEILLWAQRLAYRIAEVPVVWRDVPGSKVHPIRDGWTMLRGLWELRRTLQTVTRQSLPAVAPEGNYPAGVSAVLVPESARESREQALSSSTQDPYEIMEIMPPLR